MDDRFSGKGYITETVERITMYALEEIGARRVEIRCDTQNKKSRAIPEKLEFTLEGILQQDRLSMDQKNVRDTCVYAKVFPR